MKLTVKELKKKIENCSDDTIIHIERIEDIYFEKGIQTKNVIFQKNKNNEVIEDANYFEASSCCIIKKKDKEEVLILFHI